MSGIQPFVKLGVISFSAPTLISIEFPKTDINTLQALLSQLATVWNLKGVKLSKFTQATLCWIDFSSVQRTVHNWLQMLRKIIWTCTGNGEWQCMRWSSCGENGATARQTCSTTWRDGTARSRRCRRARRPAPGEACFAMPSPAPSMASMSGTSRSLACTLKLLSNELTKGL